MISRSIAGWFQDILKISKIKPRIIFGWSVSQLDHMTLFSSKLMGLTLQELHLAQSGAEASFFSILEAESAVDLSALCGEDVQKRSRLQLFQHPGCLVTLRTWQHATLRNSQQVLLNSGCRVKHHVQGNDPERVRKLEQQLPRRQVFLCARHANFWKQLNYYILLYNIMVPKVAVTVYNVVIVLFVFLFPCVQGRRLPKSWKLPATCMHWDTQRPPKICRSKCAHGHMQREHHSLLSFIAMSDVSRYIDSAILAEACDTKKLLTSQLSHLRHGRTGFRGTGSQDQRCHRPFGSTSSYCSCSVRCRTLSSCCRRLHRRGFGGSKCGATASSLAEGKGATTGLHFGSTETGHRSPGCNWNLWFFWLIFPLYDKP